MRHTWLCLFLFKERIMSRIEAAIITIGDELLIGQVVDTNSAWIAQRLTEAGINVRLRLAVGDTKEAITEALDEVWLKATLIIVTGGLGPTSDDITKPLLCSYFGGKLVVSDKVTEHLKGLFAARNRTLTPRNLKQAEVPDNCRVLFNRMGTAPGMWFDKNDRVVIALPGVPFEMKSIMTEEALPLIKERFAGENIVHKTLMTAGEGESNIADKLTGFEAGLPPHISIAYLPDGSFVRLRLTARGNDTAALEAEVAALQQNMAGILGKIVLSTNAAPVEQLLGEALRAAGATMGTAESCTGGYIGHCITQVPGASAYFMGSVVSYDNSIKSAVLGVAGDTLAQHGAVSSETVREMAEGAIRLLGVNYTLAVSGVLGPDGGTDRSPVGTVWMAVSDGSNTVTKMFSFFYDRERNKEMAAKNGMLFLLKYITGTL
jgi:nicotinamide-nucleotide amidase